MHVGAKDKKDCCGCTACEIVCPTGAIHMEDDKLGFYYPIVDESKCINCNKCITQCEFKNGYSHYDNYQEPKIYACRLKEEKKLIEVQSGGASAAIIDTFLSLGGVVYGAVFESPIFIRHKRIDNTADSSNLRGSKYVQSNILGIYKSIIEDLRTTKVLFIGTSCQVAGLRSVVPKQLKDNLTTVDLICHGAPSPKVWKEHIHYIEKKHKSKVVKANFRDKSQGWHSRKEVLCLKNGKIVSARTFNIVTDLSVRRSCAECPFTNYYRVGDISIGDFWGWEKHYSQWNDNKGVSVIMINSLKGEILFNGISSLNVIESSKEKCNQPQLFHPIKLSEKYDSFQNDFAGFGYEYTMKQYSDLSYRYNIMQFLYAVKARLKRLI